MRSRVAAAIGAVLSVLLAGTGVVVSVAVGWNFQQALESFVVSNVVIGLGFGLCGALLVWHRPEHPVGWLYLAGGLLQNVTAAASPLDQLVHDNGGPLWLMRLLATLFAWAWPVHIGICLPLSLALLPDGHLPSRRWRPWFVLIAVTSPLFVVEIGTSPQQLQGIPDGWWTLPHTGSWATLWTASELVDWP